MVLIISLVRNHGDSDYWPNLIITFNNSVSVSFQGISSTQIHDPLILFSSANFTKILIVQSSDIFSWLNFSLIPLRSAMLDFQFKKKKRFERANILLFRIDPFGMVSNGISLFFKKILFLILTRVATLHVWWGSEYTPASVALNSVYSRWNWNWNFC